MIYYIAQSLHNKHYICINSNLKYRWFKTFESVDTNKLIRNSDRCDTIDVWLSHLKSNNMKLILTFTRESHPEMFI